jgi:hypothetical protein
MNTTENAPVTVIISQDDIFENGASCNRTWSININEDGCNDQNLTLHSLDNIEQIAQVLLQYVAQNRTRQD